MSEVYSDVGPVLHFGLCHYFECWVRSSSIFGSREGKSNETIRKLEPNQETATLMTVVW